MCFMSIWQTPTMASGCAISLNALVSAVIFPLAFLAGSYYGIEGVAAVWTILLPIRGLHLVWLACRRLEVPFSMLASTLKYCFVCCLLMTLTVLGLKQGLPDDTIPLVRLLVESLAGAAVFIGAAFLLFKSRLMTLRQELASI